MHFKDKYNVCVLGNIIMLSKHTRREGGGWGGGYKSINLEYIIDSCNINSPPRLRPGVGQPTKKHFIK